MVWTPRPVVCRCSHHPRDHYVEIRVGMVWDRGSCRLCGCEVYELDQAVVADWEQRMKEEARRY